jgi:glycosyltransferase involved in cell wall biosynthesis
VALETSVIIPTYNRAHLLPPTLQSITSQSHKPVEVIVVDDGSTDDTEQVVRRYGQGVQYLRIENSGQCRARNVGVAASTAPWVAFCDSDDLWHPDKLALQARLLEKAPDVEYSFTNFRLVVDDIWSDRSKFDTSPSGYWDLPRRDLEKDLFVIDAPLFEHLLWHQPIFPSTIAMTRSFFEKAGRWKESLGRTLSEDLEFTLRCVERPPIGVVSTPVVGIRKHVSNFSKDALRETLGEIEILRDVLAGNPAAKQYEHALREQIIVRCGRAAEGAFAIGDLDVVREMLKSVPLDRRSWKLHLKSAIAHSPKPLARLFQVSSTRMGADLRAASGRPEKEAQS